MSFERINVLVVDDCSYMRLIVVSILRGIGFRKVHEASDGAEALDTLKHVAVDFMIADCLMPTLDGIELTKLLRTARDSPSPRLPIILMSAHTERGRILEARDAGVDEVLSKPLSAQALLDRIVAVIDQPRPYIRASGYIGPCRRRHSKHPYRGPLRRADDKTDAQDDAVNAANIWKI
jgi:two-component system, chemotaxis family, chemotaxis protein CheY